MTTDTSAYVAYVDGKMIPTIFPSPEAAQAAIGPHENSAIVRVSIPPLEAARAETLTSQALALIDQTMPLLAQACDRLAEAEHLSGYQGAAERFEARAHVLRTTPERMVDRLFGLLHEMRAK